MKSIKSYVEEELIQKRKKLYILQASKGCKDNIRKLKEHIIKLEKRLTNGRV